MCTRRLCTCRLLDVLKRLLHSEHLYGLSPVWTLMWVYRLEDTLNAFSHTWHLYGFSPLWILLCTTRSPDVVNRLLQTVHSNGFSPEWLRLCTARCWRVWQHFTHSVHLYLPVWIFICLYRPPWDEKRLSHWVHEYTFSSVCLLLCTFKPFRDLNGLLHTAHIYGLGMSSRGCSVISLLSTSLFTSEELPAYAQYSFNITEIMWHIINSSTTFINIMRTCERVGYTTFSLTQQHINTQKHSSFQCSV